MTTKRTPPFGARRPTDRSGDDATGDRYRSKTFLVAQVLQRRSTQRELVAQALQAIGANRNVVFLDTADTLTADNYEYADLLKARGEQRVGAVVEKDGSPLVYVSASAGSGDSGMALARKLANRAETAILLDVKLAADGKLSADVWPCRLDVRAHKTLNLHDLADARQVLGDLQVGLWGTEENAYQEQALRDLLVSSVDVIAKNFVVARRADSKEVDRGPEILALIGRALFTRFLLDRRILTRVTAPQLMELIGLEGELAFSTPTHAAATCDWLDRTFNGDFMPLPAQGSYKSYFTALNAESPEALAPIGWIVGRTDAGGQLPLWDRLDFSHIPAGTLSEVYEDYAHNKAQITAKRTSVHFTPRHIARAMVRQSFAGLPSEEAALAKVLDPAVGAAVFLSLAYRELARLRSVRDGGRWPDTARLRSILYEQLQGLDINADALNLAALTLYLTSIELDANPAPPEKLKFNESLVGTVLRKVGDTKPASVDDFLGSLRDLPELTGKFDIVIGNPPWTSATLSDLDPSVRAELAKRDSLNNVVSLIADRRLQGCEVPSAAYKHPDKVPDIAFLWKATQWARDGGIISLVLNQRFLIKQLGNWPNARRALFQAIEFSGFIDASEFANHQDLLWPGIEAPFCIAFARNRLPAADHRPLFLSLAVEPTLTRRRQVRIDPMATFRIDISDFDKPGGLIARTKGGELDSAFMGRLQARLVAGYERSRSAAARPPLTALGAYVNSFAAHEIKRGIKLGTPGPKAKVPKWMESFPKNAKVLAAKSKYRVAGEFHVDDQLAQFMPSPVKSGPSAEWYSPPILLITQRMGDDNEFARAAIVQPAKDNAPVVFPFAWVGAPLAQDDAHAMLAAKYCSLWVNSSFYAYFHTLNSTQLTFNIKALLSHDIESTPIVDLKVALRMELTTVSEIETLFSKLAFPNSGLQEEIDQWVSTIARFDEAERLMIQDTLSVAYPIGKSRNGGRTWVTKSQIDFYVEALQKEIQNFSPTIDVDSVTALDSGRALQGWRFVSWRQKIRHGKSRSDAEDGSDVISGLDARTLEGAVRDRYPQGQIWAKTRDGQFVFGQVALKRLWLPSRAVLTAQIMVAWSDEQLA